MIRRYLQTISIIFVCLLLFAVRASAGSINVNITTAPISFGEGLSRSAGYVIGVPHVEITFEDEEFNVWFRAYTNNTENFGIEGKTLRGQSGEGPYRGLIATNTITDQYFESVDLFCNILKEAPFVTPSTGTGAGWHRIEDKKDISVVPTFANLSNKTLSGTTAHMYIQGDFSQASPGYYQTLITVDLAIEEILPVDPEPDSVVDKSSAAVKAAKGGKITLSNGSYIEIPPKALEKDTVITLYQLNTDVFDKESPKQAADNKPLNVYKIEPEGLKFKRPVKLWFYGLKTADLGPGISAHSISKISLFHWDNQFEEWEFIGGDEEPFEGDLFLGVNLNKTGIYGIYAVNTLSGDDFRPRKRIITPACSVMNTELVFQGLSGQSTTVRIFDITGREVSKLTREPYIWDGTDGRGNIVESGIYIYQFKVKVDGKNQLVSGMVAVAK